MHSVSQGMGPSDSSEERTGLRKDPVISPDGTADTATEGPMYTIRSAS